jgi:hypothetical protein
MFHFLKGFINLPLPFLIVERLGDRSKVWV